ncbi:MAG: KPN_02809 family neutral zinc metallopeptidase [Aridibacter sp.]
MRWRDQRQSSNVEDRRGMGGGGRGIALGGGGLGMLILVGIIYLCAGGDISQLLNNLPSTTTQTQTQQQPQSPQTGGADDENKAFVSTVLASTEDFWSETFSKSGSNYREPKLVLFTNQIQSACGVAGSSTGPFYCPGDQKLYLDFGFFTELKREFNAPGDFAEAYVIAHEVGHHIQNMLGVMDKVQRSGNSNEMSVRLELQADCLAGLWAAYAQNKGLVEAGDAEEAIRAAAAVGDDMIQKRTQGYVVPDSSTHGSSEQRVMWFKRGFDSGDLKQCQTFR